MFSQVLGEDMINRFSAYADNDSCLQAISSDIDIEWSRYFEAFDRTANSMSDVSHSIDYDLNTIAALVTLKQIVLGEPGKCLGLNRCWCFTTLSFLHADIAGVTLTAEEWQFPHFAERG